MPTPAERHALLFLATVAALGGAVRLVEARRFDAEAKGAGQAADGGAAGSVGDRALSSQIAAVDSAQRTARLRKASKRGRLEVPPSGWESAPATEATEPMRERAPLVVDLNQSTARELERLPRVGPALAARIIAWRDKHGPFKSLDDLRHVRGIGPVTAALLAPSVTF